MHGSDWSNKIGTRIAAAVIGLLLSGQAAAVDLPCKAVRLVEPYPPGSATGILARIVAEKMTADLGKTVIVENRPGASGNIGSSLVARAAPDGCMFLMGTDATHAANYHLFKSLPYHPIKDATPITFAAENILVLVAHPSFPPNNIAELIAYAKAHPGEIFFGSAGIGSPHHLAGELFNELTGTKTTHVPFNGTAPALASVLGGQIMMMYSSLAPAVPHIESGKLKVFGVTTKSRYEGLPEAPSISETIPQFEMLSWLSFFGPANLPDPIVKKFHDSIASALKTPDTIDQLRKLGVKVVAGGPEELAAVQKATFESRGAMIKKHDIRIEQ